MSPPQERNARSAFRPAAIAFAWSVDAPYDWLNDTSFPAGVCCHASIPFPKTFFGVEYATTASEPLSFVPAAAPPATASAVATSMAKTILRRGIRFLLCPHVVY